MSLHSSSKQNHSSEPVLWIGLALLLLTILFLRRHSLHGRRPLAVSPSLGVLLLAEGYRDRLVQTGQLGASIEAPEEVKAWVGLDSLRRLRLPRIAAGPAPAG